MSSIGAKIDAADQLRLFIERIERLEEDKKGIADDIKDVYAEAKSNGYDVKTMRAIVRLRKMESHARQEAKALLDTYAAALGLWDSTPLGASLRPDGELDQLVDQIENSDIGMTIEVPGSGVAYKNKAARKAASAEAVQ